MIIQSKKKECCEHSIFYDCFNIDSLAGLFNIKMYELLRKLRNRSEFVLDGKLVKVYVYKKEKFIESRGKRK